MNKSIKTLSTISLILSGIGVLLAVAILTFLWEPLNALLNNPEQITKATPIIPIGNMLYILGCTVISLVLLINYRSRKPITIEVLSIVFLSLIIPFLTYRLKVDQSLLVGHTMGRTAFVTLDVSNSLFDLPLGFANLSLALSLITSGMRIIGKIVAKKKQPIAILSIISIIISVVSFLIAITILWNPMEYLYASSKYIIDTKPIIPFGSILYILGCLITVIILINSKKDKKTFTVEITSAILLSFVLPLLAWILGQVQQINVTAIGYSAIEIFIISNKVLTFSIGIAKLSSALSLVVIGMRIVYKVHYKKQIV